MTRLLSNLNGRLAHEYHEPALLKLFRDQFSEVENTKYPPANADLVKPSDGEQYYLLRVAVAGFSKEDLTIRCDGSIVMISGEDTSDYRPEGEVTEVLRQMATRKFSRAFTFGSAPVEVLNAQCKDGILSLEVHYARPPEGTLVPIK